MIQVFTVTAPLGSVDVAAVTSTLDAAMNALTRLHPSLRSFTVASADGVLTMTLNVSSRDRWTGTRAARKIATAMLGRVKIPVAGAALELTHVPPTAKSLTAAQGRSVTPGRRGPASHIDSKLASEDPS